MILMMPKVCQSSIKFYSFYFCQFPFAFFPSGVKSNCKDETASGDPLPFLEA